jgi:hypothetical protein
MEARDDTLGRRRSSGGAGLLAWRDTVAKRHVMRRLLDESVAIRAGAPYEDNE